MAGLALVRRDDSPCDVAVELPRLAQHRAEQPVVGAAGDACKDGGGMSSRQSQHSSYAWAHANQTMSSLLSPCLTVDGVVGAHDAADLAGLNAVLERGQVPAVQRAVGAGIGGALPARR